MRTVAIACNKGGTGKTTTCVNVAGALAEQGREVLVIDLDPRGSATRWLDGDPTGIGLYELFTQDRALDELAQPTAVRGVELVPASKTLDRADRDVATEIGAESRVRVALGQARPRDVVLIDTPPHLGLLVACALAAADHVLVPVAASLMDLEGVADVRTTIDVVRRRVNPDLQLSVVLTRIDDRRSLPTLVLSTLQEHFPGRVLQSSVHEAARLPVAYGLHEPITVAEPYTRAADEHRELAHELTKELAL